MTLTCIILHSQVKGLGINTTAAEKHGDVPKLEWWSNKLVHSACKAPLCIIDQSIASLPLHLRLLSQDNNLA